MMVAIRRSIVLTVLFALAVPVICAAQETATPAADAPAKAQGISEEARAAVNQGIAAMKDKRYEEATKAFLAAAKRHPRVGELRHMLGSAYVHNKQLGQAWLQYRRAVLLAPKHQPSARGFLTLWAAFDQRGVLNLGREKTQLAKLIGEPDGKAGPADREVWQYGFMRLQFLNDKLFAVIDPRGLQPEALQPADMLEIDFDDQERWRLGYRTISRLESRTQYVPAGQAVQKWEELYTVQRLYGLAKKTTPKKMLATLKEKLLAANPEIKFQVISQAEDDTIFYWTAPKKEDKTAEHELVRLIGGENDIHRLAYSTKVDKLTKPEAQKWLALLKKAKMVPTPKPATPAADATRPADPLQP